MKTLPLIEKQLLILTMLVSALLVPLAGAAETDPMDLIPADALFCVRVNNFDQSLASLDKYLAGATPMPMSLSGMARPMLGMALGDVTLSNVDTAAGSFAVFVAVIGEPDIAKASKDSFLAGILVPVKDYKKFVDENQNCTQADPNGISKLKSSTMSGQSKTFLVKQAGSMALVVPAEAYDNLLKFTKSSKKENSLNAILDADQKTQAASAPIWAYSNLQLVNVAFAEQITAGIEGVKEAIANIPNGAFANTQTVAENDGTSQTNVMEGIADLYIQLFNEMIGQLNALTVTFTPDPENAAVTISLDPVDGSVIDQMLAIEKTSKIDSSLAKFIPDDPIMAGAYRLNGSALSKYSDWVYDLLASLPASTIKRDDLDAMKDMSAKFCGSIGDTAMYSMAASDPNSKMPFEMRYVFKIKDTEKFNQLMDESEEMINGGLLKSIEDIYQGLGMKMSFKMDRGIDNYKGVSIDSAHLSMGDPNSPSEMDKMINMMYGDGFNYRIAVVGNLGVYAIGSDSGKIIRQMIDQAKSGESKTNPDFDNASDMAGNPQNTDFLGTYNYVRLLQMSMNMMRNMTGMPGMENMPAMNIDVETKSNIVFAGNSANGKMSLKVILPKEHLKEIQAAFQQMVMIQMQQMQKMKQQRQQIEPQHQQEMEHQCQQEIEQQEDKTEQPAPETITLK